MINVGTINARKNQLLLLEALSIVQSQGLDFRVQFVGPVTNAPYGEDVESFIAANVLAGRVEFLGWRDDVPRLVSQSHLLCLVVERGRAASSA